MKGRDIQTYYASFKIHNESEAMRTLLAEHVEKLLNFPGQRRVLQLVYYIYKEECLFVCLFVLYTFGPCKG